MLQTVEILPLWKTMTHLPYMVDIMADDDLATWGVRSSADMVWTFMVLQEYSVSAAEGLMLKWLCAFYIL